MDGPNLMCKLKGHKSVTFDFGNNMPENEKKYTFNFPLLPSLVHYGSRKVQFNMACLCRPPKEHDEKIDDE